MKKIYFAIIVFFAVLISAQGAGLRRGSLIEQGEPEHISVNYYPNPFNDQLNVEWSTDDVKTIALYNLLGMKIMEIPTDGISHKMILNTSNLGEGVYFLQVKTDTGFDTYRVVK